MNFILHSAAVLHRELGVFARYRTFATLSVVLPLVAFTFFIVMFKTGVPREIPIAVYDNDHSTLSRQLTRMISAAPSPQIRYKVTSLEEGRQLMLEGKVDAVVSIPKDLERDILRGKQTNVVSYISGVNISKNGLLDRDIRTTINTFSSGIQIQMLQKQGKSAKEAYDLMMPVYFEEHILFNPFTNYEYYLLPIFLPMMLLIFTIMTVVFTIGTELKNGSAGEWIRTAGGSITAALTGKILPYTVIFLILALLMNTLIYEYIGIPIQGNKFILFVSSLIFVLAYQAIGILIITLLGNMRLGLSIGGGYSVLAFSFSGLTFPFLAMDPLVRAFGYIFPLTYYMRIFIDQAMRGAPGPQDVTQLALMSIFILLPLPLLPRLKKIATIPAYWGRQ